MSIKSKVIDKLRKKVSEKAKLDYTVKLDITAPESELAMMNNRCQYNAVNAVKTGIAVAVVECVSIDKDDCSAHYINMLSNGDYVDFTLGWAWSGSDYRFVRYVHDSEYEKIGEKLGELKANLTNGFIKKPHKLIGIDEWDLC